MKKIFLLAACASLLGMGAHAQTAEELFKAGKAEFDKYDKLMGEYFVAHQQNSNAPDPTAGERATALMNGFEMLQQALPLDTIIEVNKDGTPKIDKKTGLPKYKTKFSKDIVPMLASHVNDVLNVGNLGLQGNDYGTAYKAFTFYKNLVKSPGFKGDKPTDETLADVSFYEGYAAYQLKDFMGGFKAFREAIGLGYTENQVVDFKNSCIANVIQDYCTAEKYGDALNAINDAIDAEPNSGFYYDVKGFVEEQKDGLQAAEASYAKAIELSPDFANGYYDLGRVIYDKAEKVIEQNSSATNKELAPKLIPLYEKAMPLFKKAAELDATNNTQSARFIEDIDYKLSLLK